MNARPLRSNDIRERNEKLVLRLIYQRRGVSQSEVASLTGLKPPTVFRIFSQLEEQGVIQECVPSAVREERKGRKPSYYCVRPDSFYAVGLDFWSAGAAVVVVDFGGNTVYKQSVAFEEDVRAEGILSRIREMLREALESPRLTGGSVLGIGVGAPGVVDIERGIVTRYRRIPGVENYNIRKDLERRFELPVYLHNNTSVVALSEYRYGQAQNESSVLAYLIRSGVGGAFIHNGQVFVNRGATAMEIGHMQIDRDGRVCECGGRGCLETYLSEGAMLSELQNAAGIESLEEAAARLEGDDPEVSEILDPFGDVLGDASLTLTNILNPDVFLVIARFESISRLLAEHVRSRFYAADSSYITRPPRVIAEEYDPAKACRGATDLVYDAFFALD